MFPKIIHQSWKDENLNDLHLRWSQTWKDLNPDFDYKFWTDKTNDAIVNTYYSKYSEVYNSYTENIKCVDFVRACYLHMYGGVYADLDFECLKKFEPLLQEFSDYEVILGEMDTTGGGIEHSVPNALMISKKGSEFWTHYMDLAAKRVDYGKITDGIVEYDTGSIAIRDAYLTYPNKDKIKILPKEYFYALSWTQDHVDDSLRNIRSLEKSNSLGSEYKQNNFSESYAVTYWVCSWRSDNWYQYPDPK